MDVRYVPGWIPRPCGVPDVQRVFQQGRNPAPRIGGPSAARRDGPGHRGADGVLHLSHGLPGLLRTGAAPGRCACARIRSVDDRPAVAAFRRRSGRDTSASKPRAATFIGFSLQFLPRPSRRHGGEVALEAAHAAVGGFGAKYGLMFFSGAISIVGILAAYILYVRMPWVPSLVRARRRAGRIGRCGTSTTWTNCTPPAWWSRRPDGARLRGTRRLPDRRIAVADHGDPRAIGYLLRTLQSGLLQGYAAHYDRRGGVDFIACDEVTCVDDFQLGIDPPHLHAAGRPRCC